MNRVKGLDLIDSAWRTMDRGLWHCTGGSDQDHPQEKYVKAKWLSEVVSQIAEKREAKGKEEKERYTHLNAEFQRIARRDKKAFLRCQCKDIEENNRMGKTRDLRKMRDTKGTFHTKIGSIKDKNCMDLTEVKIFRRDGKNIQKKLCKKIFMIKINTIMWSLT